MVVVSTVKLGEAINVSHAPIQLAGEGEDGGRLARSGRAVEEHVGKLAAVSRCRHRLRTLVLWRDLRRTATVLSWLATSSMVFGRLR